MPFDWHDFLKLANILHSGLQTNPSWPKEAVARSVFGRAYYAVFGYARQYAVAWLGFRGKSKAEDKTQEHGALRAFYRSKRRQNIAERLDSLRTWRNYSDYDEYLPTEDSSKDLLHALESAAYIFQNLPPPKNHSNPSLPS